MRFTSSVLGALASIAMLGNVAAQEALSCRCEYPEEGIYRPNVAIKDLAVLNGVIILPPSHNGCSDATFACPADGVVDTWNYECPTMTSIFSVKDFDIPSRRLRGATTTEERNLQGTGSGIVVVPADNIICQEPSREPSGSSTPSSSPSISAGPTGSPTDVASSAPTVQASSAPSAATPSPSVKASDAPSAATPSPSVKASDAPSAATPSPSVKASDAPSAATPSPSVKASDAPSASTPAPISPAPPGGGTCENLVIDFETAGDGAPLVAGEYIKDSWLDNYDITVSATGGYTPGSRPRLFDTANPGTNNNNGDPDLGSPNNQCSPAGPGDGVGGAPGTPGANCSPQGLVLIVQESNKPEWDDNAGGGSITFDFGTPAEELFSVGLMDIDDSSKTTVSVTTSNGVTTTFDAAGLGNNSVQSLLTPGMKDVTRVKVQFAGSGAITELSMCTEKKGSVDPAPPAGGDVCKNLLIDFETASDGTPLGAGAYIRDEWLAEYGLTLSAYGKSGGFTPGSRPRLFDTANPGTDNNNGDPDLGSPNTGCNPSGPGIGGGGAPGSTGENCTPQGLVLIIQESEKEAADDNAGGGTIQFDFAAPVEDVFSVGLMDIDDSSPTTVEVTTSDGQTTTFNGAGLGNNSVQSVAINKKSVTQIKVNFAGSGAITELSLCGDSTPVPINPAPAVCEDVAIDFETAGDGSSLTAGAYVQSEWSTYGMTVTATKTNGGYTPDNKPRLFDTANPGTNNANGDPDLGSPNNNCSPAGPGVGWAGKPGNTYSNCSPQGLVLIVQESDKVYWDDNAHGGIITFSFATPVDVTSIGLMDIDETTTHVDVTTSGGVVTRFNSVKAGNNSVQSIVIGMASVVEVEVRFAGSGAITDLNVCATKAA